MSALHYDSAGDGPPVVFVHGSFGTGASAFAAQRPLADSHRLLFVDRTGFGQTPGGDDIGWPADSEALAALLDELGAAHLVGHSYGGVVCLLAAGLRPEKTLSLVAIEPPVFEAAEGSEADLVAGPSRDVATRAPDLATEDYVREWGATVGQSRFEIAAWTEGFSESDWATADASRRERWAGDAPLPYDELAAAGFPKVLAHGGWNPEVVGRKAQVGAAFGAVCEAIAERIGAELAVFPDSTHNPQHEEATAFNELLKRVWAQAS